MEKEVTNNPKVVDERYEIEFIYDPDGVYEPGEQPEAESFVKDYIDCCGSEMKDTVAWLYKITIPEAVKFVADAWNIEYKLHKFTTYEEII